MCASSYRCLYQLLTQPNDADHPSNDDGYTANAAVVIVGGAQEAINSRPGNYTIHLKNRKGFIRIAMLHGTPLVPGFSFGEVEIFDQRESVAGSLLRRFQERMKRWTGIMPVVINGRGFLQHSFGIIPRRRQITTVIGAPIEVAKNVHPEPEAVDKLHQIFCDELQALFDAHKTKYVIDHEKAQLVIEW